MSESFGGSGIKNDQKTGYSLIYINDYIEKQMRNCPIHLWGMNEKIP